MCAIISWGAHESFMHPIFVLKNGCDTALEKTCPRSIVEIDCKKIKGQMHFSSMFVCIRACVDGFLSGCRPYLGVDSTHLTEKYNGQLATATTIDGHN
jgi:hypothetical protein